MGKIKKLSAELANQIAAGEVVERPASAVKELVENALDAGAKRVAIFIEFGGKRSIRVEDDGAGMSGDDVALAFDRHATSKLRNFGDLASIATLGFRGEALPSIASVSRVTLRTRVQGMPHGTEICIDGGVAQPTRQVGMPQGTAIAVEDLFYNVPARRKFLKSDGAETSQISRLVNQMALGYPEVGFALTSRGKQVLQCPPVSNLRERFFQLNGDRPDLVEVRKEAAGVRVSGYVAALVDQGPSRGPQNIFVNRRLVKDRTITHAVHEAYRQATIKPRTPEVHLFIDLPAERVDVNVHPMKAEVRFLEQSLIHELLRRALADALGQPTSAPIPLKSTTSQQADFRARSIPGVMTGVSAESRWSDVTDAFKRSSRINAVAGGRETGSAVPNSNSESEPLRVTNDQESQSLIPLGQFRDTFIIAIDNEGVAIIDQHVAHERVLYEQVMNQLTGGQLEGQRLLEPIVVELQVGQRETLAAHAVELKRLAFEIESFGGESVQVTTVPMLLERREAEQIVRAFATELGCLDRGDGVDDALRRLAATTACHAAVKANDRLTQEKMLHILEELRRTDYSTVCPHGRPVILRLSRQQIERSFERI